MKYHRLVTSWGRGGPGLNWREGASYPIVVRLERFIDEREGARLPRFLYYTSVKIILHYFSHDASLHRLTFSRMIFEFLRVYIDLCTYAVSRMRNPTALRLAITC